MCVDNMKERKKKSNKNGLGGKKRRKMIKKNGNGRSLKNAFFFSTFSCIKK